MRTVIRLTEAQYKELKSLKTCGAAWFERLADITECPTEVLRHRFGERTLTRAISVEEEQKAATLGWPISIPGRYMFVVVPVPQGESGVMVFID